MTELTEDMFAIFDQPEFSFKKIKENHSPEEVAQLKDEFKRFQKKQSFDMYLQAKMAGAEDLDDVDNWMDDIHP